MGETLILDGIGGSLRMRIGTEGWCKCELITTHSSTFLGADNIDQLAGRLLAALDEKHQHTIGEINGYKVSWVLSLSEAHCTLYAATCGLGRILFWQDANARLIGTIRLDQQQCAQWHKRLEASI